MQGRVFITRECETKRNRNEKCYIRKLADGEDNEKDVEENEGYTSGALMQSVLSFLFDDSETHIGVTLLIGDH